MAQYPPYSDKIYNALKSKVDGFNLSPEEFNERINDAEYQKKVYGALKLKVDGFKLSENDFYDRIKKKESTGEFSTPSPLLPQEPVQNWSKDYLASLQYQPSPLEPVQETQPLDGPVVTGTIPITPGDDSEARANKFLEDEERKDELQYKLPGQLGIIPKEKSVFDLRKDYRGKAEARDKAVNDKVQEFYKQKSLEFEKNPEIKKVQGELQREFDQVQKAVVAKHEKVISEFSKKATDQKELDAYVDKANAEIKDELSKVEAKLNAKYKPKFDEIVTAVNDQINTEANLLAKEYSKEFEADINKSYSDYQNALRAKIPPDKISPFVKDLMNSPAPIMRKEDIEKNAKSVVTNFQEEITGKIEPQGTITDITEDLAQIPPSFNKGVLMAASAIPKGVAIISKGIADLVGIDTGKIEDYEGYKLGELIEEGAKKIGITAINERRAGFFNSTVPMAFGQMIGMILTGGTRGMGAAENTIKAPTGFLGKHGAQMASGALQASVPEYEAAIAAGKDESEAFKVFLMNVPGGASEVWPIAKMFGRVNKITKGGIVTAIKQMGAQGLEEGMQEGIQQYISNKVASFTYDPKRDLKEGLLEGAGTGFIVGFLMPGIIGAMGKMTPEDKAETQKILDEVLKKGPEQTVTAPSEDLGVKPKVDEKPKEPSPKGGAATVPEVKEEEKLPIQGEQKVEGEKVVTGEAPVIKPETKSPEGQVQEGEISGKAEAGVSSTLDLKEISKSIKPEDLARFQQLSESLREGEMLLKDNIDPSGKKLTPEKRDQIVSSVESAKQKIQSLTNKGQEKISKGLESIATKIKPKVKEGVKTIKQLETENKKTFPKVPVKNVFSNDTEQPPREQRLKADKYIDEGTTATLPKQEIDVKDIVPTQKNLTIGNLEKTKDVKDSKEDIILLKHEGKFYVLDGHHRIANDILQGKKTIEANVYEDTKKTDKGNQVPDTKSKTVKKVKSTKEVTYIKQELDGRVLYEDIDGNKYEARPTRGKKTNYDIYKNSKKLDQGAKKFADIPEVIQLNRESEKRASEPIEIPTDKTDYTKVPTAELKSNLDKENDFNKRAVMKAELDVRKKESDKIAQDSGFDNASHALNSIKKRTGKEYKTVQEVPDKVLESVANERGYDKLEAKAKELTESIDQLKSENPNEFKKDGSLKSKSKITGTYKALVDMRQGVYDQMQSGFEEEFKKRGQEESEKSRIETEKINKEFDERANKDVDPEEVVFDEVNRIFGKITNEEQVTQEEVDYVNENAFLPKGFVFSESGLVKESKEEESKPQTTFDLKVGDEITVSHDGEKIKLPIRRIRRDESTWQGVTEDRSTFYMLPPGREDVPGAEAAYMASEMGLPTTKSNSVETKSKFGINGDSPLQRQVIGIKEKYPDALILFKVGDFYESFGDDAEVLAEKLDITLTKRKDKSGVETSLAGFPAIAIGDEKSGYLKDLTGKGIKVAVVDQDHLFMENAPLAKSQSVETVVENKAEELQEAATDLFKAYPQDKKLQNQRLKNQKTDLLDQMAEVEEALWGTIPKEKREAIKELDKKGTIATPFEESALEEVKKLGYEVTDKGQIVFEVKDDGTFKIHYSSLLDAIERVKKEFPEKIERVDFKLPREGGSKTPDWVKARDRGSLARNKVFLDNAKENLTEAEKAGNKKLAEAYQKELEREQKIYSEAENIDWEAESASKEMDINDEVLAWREEYENGGQKNYYNQLGFYGFAVQDFMEAKKRGLLDKGYSFEEIKTLLESDKPIQEYRKELELEAKGAEEKLDSRFARKDGKGYKQPTTNNDKAEFSRLQKTINNSENKIRVIDNIFGESAPISDKFKKFVKAVENSGSLGEARVNLQNIKGVSAELAQEFRDTFARKRDSIDQAVERFYNRVKSGQKLSKKEEAKAKIARGIEGIVNKIGGMAMVNPLDDTSVWEDVKNIIDGLADIGIAKSEEVIEYLKKELGKLGIKESDVEEKRGEIVEYVEGKNHKEPEPQEPKKESGRKKSLLNRAFEGTDDTDLAKSIEKHGLTYEPETWLHAKERAKAFVEEVGFDNALDAVRRNKIEGGSAAFVWSELIDSVGSELAEVTDEEQKQRLMKIESDLIDEFDRKAREGGRFISALQEVYASSDFGYKLDFQVEEYKKRNNGVIEPEVEERFKELDKQLTEAKAKRLEAEERAKKAEDELALQNIKESIAREKKQNTRSSQKIREAKNERAKLKSEFLSLFNPSKSGGKVTASVIPGATLAIYGVKIANTYIKEGVARIEEIVAKTKEFFDKELGYKLSPDELELIQKKIEESVAETEEKEGVVRIPHKMIRAYVESGIDTIEGLVAKIKESIKDRHPNVTDREIRDVITGYGKTINPSKDEVEVKIRKMLRIGKIISGLEDVANKKRPLRSGRQRDKLDAQERALNKELRSAMRDLPQDAETEAEQLKTSLDAVKTRLKNQIEELNLAIETGKKSAKAKGVEYDAEAKELAEQRDQIKEIYDAIFYKREDDATKIENVLKSIEKAIETTIKKIETNDLEAKKQKKIDNPDIRAARERLNRVKERLLQLQEEAGIPAKKRLEATKRRLKNQIEYLKERLRTGNYDRKKRPDPVTRDSELIKIDAEIAGLKEKFAKEQYKVELKNRTKKEKAIDFLIEVWGLSRALRATGEFSFVLIQNWVYTISHPITALRAIKTAFGHFFSEKKHEDFMNHLRAQDYYSRAKASKLAISETDVKLTAREEMFIGSYGNKLWDLLGYPLYPWKSAYEGWRSVNPLKAFERAGTGFLNTIRTTRYIEAEEMLRLQGRNFQEHPEDYKNAADVINTFTGRASLGWADRIAKPLAIVFFSPRNWASIIKQATPYAFYHFGKMNQKDGKVSVAQKMAMSDYLVAIGTTTAIVMLVDAMGGDDDEITVEKDPRSSDFMKIKIGNTRIDPWGGRQSMIVLQARLLMNSIKKESGQIQKLGQGQTSTGVELIGRIAKNKLSPSSSIAFKFFGRKTKIINGVEIWVDDYGNELYPDPESNLYPIYAETIKELYAEQPQMLAHLITFMSFWGLGTQTYDPQELKRKKYEYYQRVYDEVEAEKEGN